MLFRSKTFCDRLEAAGYFSGFYTSASFAGFVVTDAVRKRYCYWCAQWADACCYEGSCGIWQHSSTGSVPGINGRVDMDWSYQDFSAVIAGGGFNGYSKSTDDTPTPVASKTVDELAQEVIAGNWGNGDDRKNRLMEAGYEYATVQERVNELLKAPSKSIDTLAREVIHGGWGNGSERMRRLRAEGYDAEKVQKKVKELLK